MNNGETKYNKSFFTEMYVAHFVPLVTYLYQFTNNITEAEDIAQNAFTKIWQRRDTLMIKGSFKSYLYSVAYHTFIDSTRINNKQNILVNELKKEALDQISSDTEAGLDDKIKLIQSAINLLPQKCKEIFQLHKIEELSYKEISNKLGISVKTVESQMRIAYIKIRECLKLNDETNSD